MAARERSWALSIDIVRRRGRRVGVGKWREELCRSLKAGDSVLDWLNRVLRSKIMARATRSTTATHQPHPPQRKRKRASSPSATAAAKVQKTEDDGDDTTDPLPFLSEHDAQKILNVLEL